MVWCVPILGSRSVQTFQHSSIADKRVEAFAQEHGIYPAAIPNILWIYFRPTAILVLLELKPRAIPNGIPQHARVEQQLREDAGRNVFSSFKLEQPKGVASDPDEVDGAFAPGKDTIRPFD